MLPLPRRRAVPLRKVRCHVFDSGWIRDRDMIIKRENLSLATHQRCREEFPTSPNAVLLGQSASLHHHCITMKLPANTAFLQPLTPVGPDREGGVRVNSNRNWKFDLNPWGLPKTTGGIVLEYKPSVYP
ncbi:hypothetical protein Hypma_001234 [Hypsizygus marmoreus]|uniref:Uncharacterized protein n=1 Tax=Hypsizygus marmoreus TaxID=39966 RepID=A0A369J6S9_HYPMA|nr:hypothetical protein Hypma_001234 [Hypsizygus marmoreus]